MVQVVIEGVRGTGYVGDTAIDDVQVVSGADCLAAKERMLAEKSGPSTAGLTLIENASYLPILLL